MAEDDGERNLRVFELVGDSREPRQGLRDRAAVGAKLRGVVAHDMKHPEGAGFAAHEAAHFGVTAADEGDAIVEALAKIGVGEHAPVDEVEDHRAALSANDARREPGRVGGAGGRGLARPADMMEGKILAEAGDIDARFVADLEGGVESPPASGSTIGRPRQQGRARTASSQFGFIALKPVRSRGGDGSGRIVKRGQPADVSA